MSDCVFCDIAQSKAPAKVVRRWALAVAFEPLNPVVEGHILVIPVRHVADATENPQVSAMVMNAAAQLAKPPCNLITSAGVEATQTVRHLHIHVVPRSRDDGLALPWHSGEQSKGGGRE